MPAVRAAEIKNGDVVVCDNRQRVVLSIFAHHPFYTATFVHLGGCKQQHTWGQDQLIEKVK